MNIRPVGAEFYADGRAGGPTDMTKLVVNMRTKLISHHGARLSMQLRKMERKKNSGRESAERI